MIWRYVAVNALAQEVSASEWGSRREVVLRLKEQGLELVSLQADAYHFIMGFMAGGMFPAEKLAYFLRDFGNMLSAGLAVNHILGTFKGSGFDPRLAAVCAKISEELSLGKHLAQAMEETKAFPRLAVQAISAGERAGNLPVVMGILADYFLFTGELKGKCLRALIYPACVFIFLLAALIYVSQAVVPQIAPLLPSAAFQSPLTRSMLGLSALLRAAWVPILGSMAALLMTAAAFIRHDPRAWDEFLMSVPVIGVIRKNLEIALSFFDLYIRLKSGIPLDAALGEGAVSAGNVTGSHLEHCREHLAAGLTFSAGLAREDYFPRLVIETVRMGEDIGCYDGYCERVFKVYYRSFETQVGMLVAAVQPLVLGVCALFIMAMALAFLQPIYANLTHIGNLKP